MSQRKLLLIAAAFACSVTAHAEQVRTYECLGASFFGGTFRTTLTFRKGLLGGFSEVRTVESDGKNYYGANLEYRDRIKDACEFEGLNGQADYEEPCIEAKDNSRINPFGDFAYLGFKEWRGTKFSELPAVLNIEIDTIYGSITNRMRDRLNLTCTSN